MTANKLTESQLIGLANIVDLIEQIDPNFSGASIAGYADIARSGRRHNGILPSEAMGYCVRTVERYGLTWTRDRGWVVPRSMPARPLPEVTDDDIHALRREAIDRGDDMQHAICERALDPDPDTAEDSDGEWFAPRDVEARLTDEQANRLRRMTQAQARLECARVIAEARAQAVRS